MTRISEPQPPVVVLAGFMGTGKTEVGRALADILDVEFVDTDSLVENEAGMTIAEIFERHGEARFREMEAEVCRNLAPIGGAVVATGGGTLFNLDNFRRLCALGTVVLLESTVDAMIERLKRSKVRPLLHEGHAPGGPLRDRVEQLLEERRPIYDRIKFRVDTTGRSPAEAAAEIASALPQGYRIIRMTVDVRPLPASNGGRGRSVVAAERSADPSSGASGRVGVRERGDGVGESRIVIGRGAVAKLGPYLAELGLRSRAFLFMPKRLCGTFLERIRLSLDCVSIPHEVVPVEDGDASKNLAQVRDLIDRLASSRAGRDNPVVSIGGGVTGDVAGFVAATYMRGLPFVQVPTTLISQVDASIGGKVGVNHPRAKNLIGAFYQPLLILDDPLMLEGLPADEIAMGMSEVVKTAIIGSPELFDYIGSAADGAPRDTISNPEFLEHCTFECVRVKSSIVERDPYERDLRRVLNLGHTLGHALESALEYEGVKHGEAVALGTIAAIRVAVERGRAEKAFLQRTIAMLEWCGLPTRTPPVDRDLLRRALELDKKVKSGRLFFVLPLDVGRVEIVSDVTPDELLGAL
jgi:shikimate kinase/3-dehydroquinate synthase